MKNNTTSAKKSGRRVNPLSTDEGQRRQAEYHYTLGKFVDQFARVESVVAIALMWHAKISQKRARAVFSGVRMDVATGHLRRLASIDAISPSEWAQMEPVVTQIGHLNTARNLILHYGGRDIASGGGHVSDARSALMSDKVRHILISPTILERMTCDLNKAYAHFALLHCGRKNLASQYPEAAPLLSQPWLHKPPQQAKTDRQRKQKGRAR